MKLDRTETRIDRELLDALRALAAEEGRDEYEVVDDAARLYLRHHRRPGIISESLERARERRERLGIPELPEEEALRLAVEEQHAHRSEAGGE